MIDALAAAVTQPHAAGAGSSPLSASVRVMSAVANATPVPMLYIDRKEICRFANTAAERLLRRKEQGIVGCSLRDLFGGDYAAVHAAIADSLGGKASRATLSPSPSSSPSPASPTSHAGAVSTVLHCVPDRSADGSVDGVTVTLLEAPPSLQGAHSEQAVPASAESAPVFIAQFDRNYRLRTAAASSSDGAAHGSGSGSRSDDAIGLRISDIMGEDAFAILREYVDAALAGKAQQVEVKMPSAHAGDEYMQMMYVPERDERGQVRGLIAAISDITKLRRTEEKLHRREQEFKTLVENSPDIIARFDCNMRHLYVNPAVEAAFGRSASAYLGKTNAQLGLPAEIVAAWNDATERVFASGSEQQFEFEQLIDGRARYFTTRLIPEFDRSGNIESLLGITYDVTDRTKMEKEREVLLARERNARIQAETAARARDEFLAIVSHELRAPLNGIQSWAHVLESYARDAVAASVAQRALQGIKTGVAQQVRLIEDLLDVTRMMSGKLRLVKQPFAILPVIQSAVQSVRDLAAAKRIAITSSYQIRGEQIEGDPDRVQQVIWNLLTNAIKFTPENGAVWLGATVSGKELCLTVSDNGIGISPDFLPHLFDRFSQKDTSSTRGHGGLGLGLFLVRYLVELHGGSVEVKSEGEGRGTTFFVYLPLRGDGSTHAQDECGSDGPMQLPSLEGLRILLVDDQEEARESLTLVLQNAGADVFSAPTAQHVFDWLATLPAADYPDLLICDIAMPGEDGYSVLRRIRAWNPPDEESRPLQRMPALALTAFSQREDRIKALTAGFQMHVTKPVAPEELIVVIDTMTSRGGQEN